MDAMHLTLEETRLDDGTHLLVAGGDLDTETAPLLVGAFDRLLAAGGRQVVLDLAGVRFMDSSGLVALMNATTRMRKVAGDLRVASPSPSVSRLLGLTRMDKVFAVFATREAAIGGDVPAGS